MVYTRGAEVLKNLHDI